MSVVVVSMKIVKATNQIQFNLLLLLFFLVFKGCCCCYEYSFCSSQMKNDHSVKKSIENNILFEKRNKNSNKNK